ncbi:MAG: amidophosphoribosyltransferase [Bacteroidetes bacterium]|nr:amidophosphoribosyltransferase [Bacteroidota bacterium]
MSEPIKHECGIALIRLLKPLEFYVAKYGTAFYGLNKLHLMLQKQHNRGQDGAGIACIKLDLEPGHKYIDRERSNAPAPLREVFTAVYDKISDLADRNTKLLQDVNWLKYNMEFTGELLLGHLRYGTFGKNNPENLHPFIRFNNWMTKTLVLAGNFNLTNVDELFDKLIDLGQYPVDTSDTITMLEKIGHFLDQENELLYQTYKNMGMEKRSITIQIAENLDIKKILSRSAKSWDGGYAVAGLIGHGDAFVLRDPSGIRPAYYYANDEIVVAASERPVIQTTFSTAFEEIMEIQPGHALIIKKNGKVSEEECIPPLERKACSFERIYFSRGTDVEIYKERKKLGRLLAPTVLKAVDYDLSNTVFSYIPNTASVAFRGLMEAVDDFCNKVKRDKLFQAGGNMSAKQLEEILSIHPRIEIVAVKDIKLRTFITQESQRDDLAGHVYDITYGSIRPGLDNLVVIDDSIVRGTTLKQSIIRILDRLGPRKIIIASSAPQIRYPDCYGIDMAKLTDFIAFKAAIELLKETRQQSIINDVYNKSKAQEKYPKEKIINFVKQIYKPFTAEQISEKITAMLTPNEIKAEVQIIFQKIEDLHEACPKNLGDWYFTGDYPTPGGNKVVNKAFINYIEGRNIRPY